MRGIISLALLIFSLGVVMLAGPVVEDVADVASNNDAVKQSPASGAIDRIVAATLQWVPLMSLVVGVVASLVWYLRRQRVQQRRRL